jgi:lipoprotein-anchoring transpeptidase ErfK/SrfK
MMTEVSETRTATPGSPTAGNGTSPAPRRFSRSAAERRKPWSERESLMVPASRFVLRGALAAAVAVLASSLSGTVAVAQQIAVNTEDQAVSEPSPDEERPGEADTRQIVPLHTSEAPGTIIIDTGERYLYLVQPNDLAIRYGIGVGRIGFQWSGVERVSQKQEWPDWRVPSEMVGRQPYLPRFMAGGPGNPLGARALYLGHTVFRIHGTNQPETIGHAVSSGCFRLDNADVIDLYDRVQVGAKVLVRQSAHIS